MFTGLVEELGIVQKIDRGPNSARLTVRARSVLEGIKLGDSVAVNGVCLTVVDIDHGSFTVEVMAETLKRTNLDNLASGKFVNLERALRLDSRLDGHLVSGHVDGMGTIVHQEKIDIALVTTIRAPDEILRYLVEKGSVAVDGISLTVVSLVDTGFVVSLIPHTVQNTTLCFKKVGDIVNLEVDIIAKYVERFLKRTDNRMPKETGLSLEFLQENGFA